MKFAAVISVGHGPEGLAQATYIQSLLLDHMGEKLGSIRLTVPRLLHLACQSATAERPDVMVVAGGPRTARRAGEIAHRAGIPILFLPGLRSPDWGERLWGTLSLEEMVTALAREEISLARMSIGMAGERIFFGDARCGLIPQLAHLNQALGEAEAFSEGWTVLGRAASIARSLAGPRVRYKRDDGDPCRAATLVVTAQSFDGSLSRNLAEPRLKSFSCSVWKHRSAFAYVGAALRAVTGSDWRQHAEAERFECSELALDLRAAPWLVLDGEPVSVERGVTLSFHPDAVRVCRFQHEKCGPAERDRDFGMRGSKRMRGRRQWNPWNIHNISRVSLATTRSGGKREKSEV